MHNPPYHDKEKAHAKTVSPDGLAVAETVAALKGLAIFAGLSEECLVLFAERAEDVTVQKGENLYREGEQGNALFVVRQGSLSVRKNSADKELVLATLGEGDVFGEMSFIDMQPRSATVNALSQARLYRFSYSALEVLRREKFKPFTLLYMNLAREISRRLRRADDELLKRK